MTEPIGPVFAGNFEEFAVTQGNQRYRILYLPDKNNSQLQAEGKAPHYYWMPGAVRIATDDRGSYKFHLTHFAGIRGEDNIGGGEDEEEISGGVLSVTTTAAPPSGVLAQSHEQLLAKFTGKADKNWGWRSPAEPQFGAIPIVASNTTMSNLSPAADGTVAAAADRSASALTSRRARIPRTLQRRAERNTTQLDSWLWQLQGQGPGSIDPGGENAYTALLGSLPTLILWEGFQKEYSPVSLVQALKLKLWSETFHLSIRGSWDRIFNHFSEDFSANSIFHRVDVKSQFQKLVTNGTIEVEMTIDGTTPNADAQRELANQQIEIIVDKFMEQAQKAIFDVAPPEVEAAQNADDDPDDPFAPWRFIKSTALTLKAQRDEQHLDLSYSQTINEAFVLDHVISSTLGGFYDEIKADPEAEGKYFSKIFVDDWDRKVTRMVKPVVNWPDPTRDWVGDPVEFVSCQMGYPNARGEIQWSGQTFDQGSDETWRKSFTQKAEADVASPPAEWTSDKTFIKRRIHFSEPPGELASPYERVYVEKNTVDLDGEGNGTLVNDINNEVRLDSVGKLEVGPILLSVGLTDTSQFVEVTFRPLGKTHDGNDRTDTTMTWQFQDQDRPRYLAIFTGQPDYGPDFKYRVRVVVRGSLFSPGQEWRGDWTRVKSNGNLMVRVPTPGQAVASRRLTPREVTASGPPPPMPAADTEADSPSTPDIRPVGPPPSDRDIEKAA